jgi:hypothetical protein
LKVRDEFTKVFGTIDEELWFGFDALLDVADSLMKNLPDQAAQAMCDGPDSGLITQMRQPTPEHCLKVGAFAPGSSMSGLVEHAAHVFVAFRRTAARTPASGQASGHVCNTGLPVNMVIKTMLSGWPRMRGRN